MSESNGSSVAAIAKRHFNEVQEIAGAIDLSVLDEIVICLRDARLRGAMVYVMGNGGSAATASHMATDIGKNTSIPGKDPIKIISLGDNLPWVTALSIICLACNSLFLFDNKLFTVCVCVCVLFKE